MFEPGARVALHPLYGEPLRLLHPEIQTVEVFRIACIHHRPNKAIIMLEADGIDWWIPALPRHLIRQ